MTVNITYQRWESVVNIYLRLYAIASGDPSQYSESSPESVDLSDGSVHPGTKR